MGQFCVHSCILILPPAQYHILQRETNMEHHLCLVFLFHSWVLPTGHLQIDQLHLEHHMHHN